MKKLLGILVLGLLFSGNASAGTTSIKNTVWVEEGIDQVYGTFDKIQYNFLNNNKCSYKYIEPIRDKPGPHYDCNYSESNNKIVMSINKGWLVCNLIDLGNNLRGTCKSKTKKYKNLTLEFEAKLISESRVQPSEPKPSLDDNKVVAASSGSGFFVTRTGHLVTNYHVVEECDAVKVSFNAKEIQADTIAIDKFNDLAIIKAKINPSKVFPVSKVDVSLLQDIIVAGFPLGKRISALIKTHKGSVTGLAGIGDNYSNFQTDATINHGNSGGPILTQKGNVIGVAVQLIPPDKAQNIFFGVKSSTLTTFAKANNVNFLPPNTREMSNKDLGELITEATVFLECWMTVAKIKQMIAQEENRKAFYSKFK